MNMNAHVEIGRVGGVPVTLDASFILLVVLWGQQYFTAGSLTGVLMGLWIVGGLAASILVHELAHAFAARRYGVRTSHVELNGLGGLCHYVDAAPSRQARVVMALAGPASNLVLFGLLEGVAWAIGTLPPAIGGFGGHYTFMLIAETLANTNLLLFWFNLLPSHPLDGGTALANLLGGRLGYDRAMRLIAWTGMAVVGWLVLLSLDWGFFTAFIALYLFLHNQEALTEHKRPRWRRHP
jgi:stage IV sporulation protein FB